MHSFRSLEDAVSALRTFGYDFVISGPNGLGFSKGTGRAARHAVLARKGSKFVIRYV